MKPDPRTLNTLMLKVEVLAGSDIQEVAQGICSLADTLGILIEAQFNSALLLAAPGNKPEKIIEMYRIAC